MILLLTALAFVCGFLWGRKTRSKKEYDIYKKTNGLFEPVKRN